MIARHSFYESQWLMPTAEQWEILHHVWNEHGDPGGRPYLQRDRDEAVSAIGALKSDKAHLRAEYEALRVPFTLPPGITNVWTHPQVGGAERLKGPDGKALHPCQKPLAFSDRMIRASTNPGDLVLEPFGGTCRVAVACERMPEPEARRYVCIEPDQDGREYIAAVLPSLRCEPSAGLLDGQCGLFGTAP